MGAITVCSICKKAVLPRAENSSYPFCSPRCRQVDLGRWLGEEYRVASRHAEEEEDEGAPPHRSGSESGDGDGGLSH